MLLNIPQCRGRLSNEIYVAPKVNSTESEKPWFLLKNEALKGRQKLCVLGRTCQVKDKNSQDLTTSLGEIPTVGLYSSLLLSKAFSSKLIFHPLPGGNT